MRITLLAAVAAVSFLSPFVLAQGVDPIGRVHPRVKRLGEVAVFAVPALDRLAIAQEDEQLQATGVPVRFAMPNFVAVNPETHGTWEELDTTWSLWRLRIQAPGSSHVNLGFTHFHMPGGARLMVYSSDYQSVIRPFDANDHSPAGELWTPVVRGEEIVAELYVQTARRAQVALDLTHIGAGYRMFGAGPTALGTDGSGSCNVDVVCPQAAAWGAEISAVARITIGGSSLCSGCMVNNTAQDLKNYFMTADHCGAAGNPASVVAYWNYENTTCGAAPDDGVLTQFNTGAVLRATWNDTVGSDFTLLELNSAPNPAWGVTYAGWNRTTFTTVSTSAVGIHHPSGDTKKISFENNSTVTTSYGGTSSPGNGRFVRVIDWDEGVTEGGSSGSPLFDQNHRIIGFLTGGSSACGNNLSDWYGKFGASWTGGGTNATRLSNWLDPSGIGGTTLDTLEPAYAAAETFGEGCYAKHGSFYELFAPASFDLGGTVSTTVSLSLTPILNGYQVQSGPNAWFTPISASIPLQDEGMSTRTLPFLFQFPGGATSQIRMCANGYIWLSNTGAADYTPTAAELAGGARRLAPCWLDLDGTSAGSFHQDNDPSGLAVYFTWLGVPAWNNPGPTNTFQLVLRQDQSVEFRYRSMANMPFESIVGWSRGAAAVPPEKDISTSMPFQVSVDQAGLSFNVVGSDRPIQGTTMDFLLSNIVNPGSSVGIVVAGPRLAGIDLAIIGAAGCPLYADLLILYGFPVGGPTQPWSIAIPIDGSLTGSKITCQGALLTPGVNPFGALTANAVELTFGLF